MGARPQRDGAKLQTSKLQGAKLESAKTQPAPKKALKPAELQKAANGLAQAGLSGASIKGAVSSVPKSQLGRLFYDVAQVLEIIEGGVTETSVGYYMASLTDPEGAHFKSAKTRLEEIILDKEITLEQAVALYDGGLSTFMGLYDLKLGMTREAVEGGLKELRKMTSNTS